jgi:group I intron endonuclease
MQYSKDSCLIYGLYSTKSPDNIRYIGQTTRSIRERMSGHRKDSKKWNSPVYRWWIKHESEGFLIKAVPICIGKWNETEIDCISSAKSLGFDLLNISEGGKGSKGSKRTEEQRRIMSELRMGKQAGAKNGMFGRTHTVEARAKISAAQRALPKITEEMRAKKRAVQLGLKHTLKTKICPHCLLSGKGGNMTRFHFWNCKFKAV